MRIRLRKASIVAITIGSFLAPSSMPLALGASTTPPNVFEQACKDVSNVNLPTDPTQLAQVQMAIIRCAYDVFLKNRRANPRNQCVPFAYELLKIVNRRAYDKVHTLQKTGALGRGTAANYFGLLSEKGLITDRSKFDPSVSQPSLIWWDKQVAAGSGHVGVYIGSGLYIDIESARNWSPFAARLAVAREPDRWTWAATTTGSQTSVVWVTLPKSDPAFPGEPRRPKRADAWPKRNVWPVGFSTERVQGGK